MKFKLSLKRKSQLKDTVQDNGTHNDKTHDTGKEIKSKPDKEIFETSTFTADVHDYLDRYDIGAATVTITQDHQYLVSEPQFRTIQDKHAYDTIMDYKQLLHADPTHTSLDQLMTSIKSAADELGLLDVLNRNYKTFQYYVNRDILGYEILDTMMKDSEHLEDITCSDYTSVGVIHRDYLEQKVLRSNVRFKTIQHMNVFLERISRMGGKHISSSDPIIDFHLGERYRVAIISDEITMSGVPSLSIRLKADKPFTISHMLQQNVIPIDVIAVIWKMLDFRGTGLIIGGTGAGKSSFLNTLFPLLHRSSKIMSIEDAAELAIPQFDWSPLSIDVPITSPQYTEKFAELLNAVLRHRPDMIAVGEVRGRSTKNLFEVMSTGHSSLSSFHASSADTAVSRITTELDVHPASFAHLWFILHMAVIIGKDKRHIRKCISFDEVHWNGTTIELINLAKYDALSDTFEGADINDILQKSKKLRYISKLDASSTIRDDLYYRKSLLERCIEHNAYTPRQVMEILSKYG